MRAIFGIRFTFRADHAAWSALEALRTLRDSLVEAEATKRVAQKQLVDAERRLRACVTGAQMDLATARLEYHTATDRFMQAEESVNQLERVYTEAERLYHQKNVDEHPN